MTLNDIARMRLANQQLAAGSFDRPEQLVAYMGAMQAQDYPMAKWAIGVRMPGHTDAAVEQAIDAGLIIRTHVMRPTWHLVAASDARWMMDLTGPRIRNMLNANNQRLGLTEAVLARCNKIIEALLADGAHLTRKEIMEVLNQHKIATDDLRSSHIMYRAEVDGIVCSGRRKGKENTYAHFDQRLPHSAYQDRIDAVGELMKRYVASHGPVTLADFVWWSGLTMNDAKAGIEINRHLFQSEKVEGQTYWFAPMAYARSKSSLLLLPAFDEYLVSYKDREASLPRQHFSSAITKNGIFSPVIVAGGKVIGTWKRTLKKEVVLVEPAYFEGYDHPDAKALQKAAGALGRFLGYAPQLIG